MTLDAMRTFAQSVLVRPFTAHQQILEDGDRVERLWHDLRYYADVPNAGQSLFAGSLQQRREWAAELRGYITAAKANYEASVNSANAGLSLYYCALNLAKAELLVDNPSGVSGIRLAHGLSYSPHQSKAVTTDVIRWQAGVFSLLYQKRLGIPALAPNTEIPIKRLLGQCQELGGELKVTQMGQTHVGGLSHLAATDGQEVWSVLLVRDADLFLSVSDTSRRFAKHFKEVEPRNDWPEIFHISRAYPHPYVRFFESRSTVPNAGPGWPQAAAALVHGCLKCYLDGPVMDHDDATLVPSLYKSKDVPMPGSLARYALMFYLSSIVRYKPQHLDRLTNGEVAWVFDEFVRLAPLRLIQSARDGITAEVSYFLSPHQMRT